MGSFGLKMKSYILVGPREKTPKKCGDEGVLDGRKPLQMGWYEFAAALAKGQKVLDVGCGSGSGLRLLSSTANEAVGIDLDPRLEGDGLDIRNQSICELPSKSFDLVVCIDVIEHVEDDKTFVKQLARVARKGFLISTPNFAVSRNKWPYHVREYIPYELEHLVSAFGKLAVYGGDSHGNIRQEIRRRRTYYFLNFLYSFWPTLPLGKILKRLLFARIWPHQCIIVTTNE
jgi:SAM-dependent methyltransferase